MAISTDFTSFPKPLSIGKPPCSSGRCNSFSRDFSWHVGLAPSGQITGSLSATPRHRGVPEKTERCANGFTKWIARTQPLRPGRLHETKHLSRDKEMGSSHVTRWTASWEEYSLEGSRDLPPPGCPSATPFTCLYPLPHGNVGLPTHLRPGELNAETSALCPEQLHITSLQKNKNKIASSGLQAHG